MRTDAKIGFAIGAVLLAVLTVYAIVVPKKRTTSLQGVAIVTPKVPTNASPVVTPSNGVTLVDKTDTAPTPSPAPFTSTTPSSPVAVDSAPTPAPATSTPPAPDSAVATAKSADGVDWNKLIGTPNTPSTPMPTPPPMYSVTPPNGNAAPTADTGSTSSGTIGMSSASTDTPSFRPSPDGGNESTSSKSTTAGHVRSSSTPVVHKSSRSHGSDSTAVASSSSHGVNTGAEQYVVEAGDTLSGIAAAHYGAAHYYTQILKANPSVDPNRMRPGTKLTLPDLSSAIAAAKSSGDTAIADLASPRTSIRIADGAAGGGVFTPGTGADTLFASSSDSPSNSGGSYTVHAGDNLYRISKKLYGTSKMANEIFAANKDEIGSDMSKLKLGMVLTLPEAPTN